MGALTTAELFAGIGGFRLAADENGLRTVWANDINELAAKVYRDRFGGNVFVEGDITKLIDEIPDHDVLTAGFPCQPFSKAGKSGGRTTIAVRYSRPHRILCKKRKPWQE